LPAGGNIAAAKTIEDRSAATSRARSERRFVCSEFMVEFTIMAGARGRLAAVSNLSGRPSNLLITPATAELGIELPDP